MNFWQDARGMTALYIGLAAPLLFGLTALAIDLGRVMSLQSELQSAADAAALAGAAELDRQTNAITRAEAAAGCPESGVSGAFGTNSQTFATDGDGTGVSVVSCTFFSTLNAAGPLLPPNGSAQGGSATTRDNAANFIKVVVQVRTVANAFITLVGGPQAASTTATATAGFTQITCKPMQLMICNPAEGTTSSFSPQPGQELFMPYSGGTASAPGNWGLMDAPPTVSAAAQSCGVTPGGNSAPVIEAYLGQAQPIGCFATDLLVTRPGKPTPVAPALNVLLDYYNGAGVSRADSCFPPALNVTKGMDGPACSPNPDAPPAAEAFPQDSTFTFSGALGNGNWDINNYWAYNHTSSAGCTSPTCYPSALTTFAQNMSPSGMTPAGIPSRYATYLYEINQNMIPTAGTPSASHKENGAPACYFNLADPNITASRRLVDIGLVNCNQQRVGGRSTITPYGVLQVFMIRPTDSNGLYFVVVKQVQAGSGDGILNNVVQLYR